MKFKFCPRCLLVVLLLTAPFCDALADDRGPIDQDFQVSVGGFFMQSDTTLRLDGDTTGTGTDVDWESEFDLKDSDRFRVDAFWRFAARHKVRLMYFENNRSNTRTLTRDIDFGDTTFPVDLQVDARLETRIIELAYEYAFLQRDNMELAGSFGIHNIELESAMKGAIISPGGGGTAEVEEVGDATGPLPVIGLRYLWHIGGNFYFDGIAQFFYVEWDNNTGSIQDYKVGVTWIPWQNVGIGVGYNKFITRLDVSKDDFSGKMEVGYGGAMAFLTVGF